MPEADIEVINCGTIFQFVPLTPAGDAFLHNEVSSEPWQWLGGSLNVDHRYAEGLANAAVHEGLELR